MTQPRLFGPETIEAMDTGYPNAAGWKAYGTSQEAAVSVDASTIRASVRECLKEFGGMTSDECAYQLGLSVLAVRPRFSELRAKGEVFDTTLRRTNASGKRATVWGLTG